MGARYIDIFGTRVNVGKCSTLVASSDNNIHLTTWNLGEFDGVIEIGDYCLLTPGVRIAAATKITIGDGCMFNGRNEGDAGQSQTECPGDAGLAGRDKGADREEPVAPDDKADHSEGQAGAAIEDDLRRACSLDVAEDQPARAPANGQHQGQNDPGQT